MSANYKSEGHHESGDAATVQLQWFYLTEDFVMTVISVVCPA